MAKTTRKQQKSSKTVSAAEARRSQSVKKSQSAVIPKVSVIVTCYKGGEFLPRCLKSLTEQTLKEIEIICVNDGSPDNTREVLEEWSQKDARVRAIHNPTNVGVSAARNIGLRAARAEFVTFCDADDYNEPTYCEELYQAMVTQKVDVAICGTRTIYEAHPEMKFSDDNYYSLKYSGRQTINEDLILNVDLSPANKMFRRDLIESQRLQFPEGLYYEDAYFCVAYFCGARKIYFLSQQLHIYIRHENSTMSNTWSGDKSKDHAIDHLYVAFRLYDFLRERRLLARWENLYWRVFIVFGYFAIENSKSRARVRQVKREAAEFVRQHQESLARAEPYVQEEVKLMVSQRLSLNPTRLKRRLLPFMPTYKLQSMNIQRLRWLKNEMEKMANDE